MQHPDTIQLLRCDVDDLFRGHLCKTLWIELSGREQVLLLLNRAQSRVSLTLYIVLDLNFPILELCVIVGNESFRVSAVRSYATSNRCAFVLLAEQIVDTRLSE
jgi:hypothetical protein